MKKNIFRIIIASIIAVLLIISCDSHVISEWAGGTSYTEVLENNGSFVYNGKHYDNLSSAVKAASEAFSTEEQVITVTGGNVISRSVEITGSDVNIVLDLGGKNIMFLDVTDAAVTASEEAVLTIQNGSMSLNKKDSTLAAVSVEGGAKVTTLNINVSGNLSAQNAELKTETGTIVEGAVTAKDNAVLSADTDLSDVRMQGASLIVGGNAKVVVKENSGTNQYAQSPQSEIKDETEENPIDKSTIAGGVWYITRGADIYYYGSLEEVLDSLTSSDTGKTLTLFAEDTHAASDGLVVPESVTLDFGTFSVSGLNNLVLAEGKTLTLTGTAGYPAFNGGISSAEGVDSCLEIDGVEIKGALDISGTLTAAASVFDDSVSAKSIVLGTGDANTFKDDVATVENMDLSGSFFTENTDLTSTNGDVSFSNTVITALGSVTASGKVDITKVAGTIGNVNANDGDVTIDNSQATAALSTGTITASGNVTATGNANYNPVVGGISSGGIVVCTDTIVSGNIIADTSVTMSGGGISNYEANVYAPVVSLNVNALSVGTIAADSNNNPAGSLSITAAENTTFYVSKIYADALTTDTTSGYLEVGTLTLSGVPSGISLDNGYYHNLVYNVPDSTETLVLTKGNYSSVSTGDGDDTVVLAGTFSGGSESAGANYSLGLVAWSSSQITGNVIVCNAFVYVNELSSLESVVSHINTYDNYTQKVYIMPSYEDTLVVDSTASYTFTTTGTVVTNAVTFDFGGSFNTETKVIGSGLIVSNSSTLTLSFANNILTTGKMFIEAGSELKSSRNFGSEKVFAAHKESTTTYTCRVVDGEITATYENPYYIYKPVLITLYKNDPDSSDVTYIISASSGVATTLPTFAAIVEANENMAKEGYTFDGWATSSSATSATYTDGQNVTLTADTTLYAVWMPKVKVYFDTSNVALVGHDDDYYVELSVGSSFTGLPTATIDNENYSSYVVCGWKTVDDYYVESITVPAKASLTLNSIMCYTWTNTMTNSLILSYRPIFADTTSYQSVSTATGSKWHYTYYNRNEDYYYYVTTPSAKFYTEWNQKYWNLIYEVENAPEISTVYTEDLVKNLIGQKALWALASANHSGASSVTYNLTGSRYVTVTSSSMSFGDGNPSTYSLTSSYVWQTMDVVTE